ncbi:MAG: DoxX family protein, partial [Burkholderiales bacterium]|nr:DoxX family protein [Burkholderiales bacterium]
MADDIGKLVLRLTLGGLILLHGISKVKNGVEGIAGMLQAQGLPAALAYGVYVGEVIAALLVLAGFYARIGADSSWS